ncbi:hypothetical protein LY78DRAFT_155932 [Colletotrichum sublineola]|nr:hypothetical protein LY78DRAFT_155932 [Colletotrichum sublineola]
MERSLRGGDGEGTNGQQRHTRHALIRTVPKYLPTYLLWLPDVQKGPGYNRATRLPIRDIGSCLLNQRRREQEVGSGLTCLCKSRRKGLVLWFFHYYQGCCYRPFVNVDIRYLHSALAKWPSILDSSCQRNYLSAVAASPCICIWQLPTKSFPKLLY